VVLKSRRNAAFAILTEVLGIDEEQAETEAAWMAASASPLLGRHLIAWRTHAGDARG